jgi:large subunit ribosomal protein L10
MTREEKNQVIEDIAVNLRDNNVIYLADVSEMDAEASSKLRRLCFNKNVSLKVVKKHTVEESNGTCRRKKLR